MITAEQDNSNRCGTEVALETPLSTLHLLNTDFRQPHPRGISKSRAEN